MSKAEVKRRKYFINPRAQGPLILRFVAASAIGGGLGITIFNYFAFRKLDSVLYGMRLPNTSTGNLLMQELLISNIFVMLFILAAFAVTARIIFQRLNGPLKRLEQDIAKIGHGDLSVRVQLRKNDDFQELATDLNNMIESLRQRFSRCRETSKEIEHILSSAISKNSSVELQNALHEVHDRIERLSKEVQKV